MSLNIKNLPQNPGVYLFKNKQGEVIYVGKAINLKNRIKSYFQKQIKLGEKTRILVENIASLETIKVESEIEALLLEANLIQKYQPKYNVELKDDKSYPYIKITYRNKTKYFGPYPDASTVKLIIRKLRIMFMFKNEPVKTRDVILFLEGKKDLLLKKLNKKMHLYSNQENFEKANEIRIQINKIKNLTKPIIKPYEYLKNPNLFEDQIKNSLLDLSKVLNLKNLQRIECFDVANISGQFATAAMIVFTNGQKDTDSYRRFKIHITGVPNDYKMLEETLTRRFKHKEWPYPNLVVIDGGLGQLNVFKNLKINIPSLALAKRARTELAERDEQIYYKDQKIILKPGSPALKLLQRIRDEAHRFATTYHKKLRQKSLTSISS